MHDSAALIRGEALVSMWVPKHAALIRGGRLFEARCLLEGNAADKNVRTTQQKTMVRIFQKIPRSYCNRL